MRRGPSSARARCPCTGVTPTLRRAGGRSALVLSTPGQRALATRVAGVLGDAAAGTFDGAAEHTPVEVTDAALARAKEVGADSVVSVGGGSTTGLGKALAAPTGMPHVVLPTTYAGSEVTPLLGETAHGEKVTRTGPEILPEVVVYDVELTTTLPWPVTVTSAVNAMAHAVEALYAPDRTAESDRMAAEGLGALAGGLTSLFSIRAGIALVGVAGLMTIWCGYLLLVDERSANRVARKLGAAGP